MTAKFTVSGSNTKIIFEYIAPTAKISEIALAAAGYLWEHGYGDHGSEDGPILFDDTSNQDKLNMIDAHVRRVIMDLAKSHTVTASQVEARKTAIVYAKENLNMT